MFVSLSSFQDTKAESCLQSSYRFLELSLAARRRSIGACRSNLCKTEDDVSVFPVLVKGVLVDAARTVIVQFQEIVVNM